jgi:hypothetical protein
VDYRQLLWHVLDAGLVLEKVHKELTVVQEHVTGATEVADLGIIQGHLTEVRTMFGKVHGRAQAGAYCAQLQDREPSLSELGEQTSSAALAMLPDIATQLEVISAAVAHISDAVLPVPPGEE